MNIILGEKRIKRRCKFYKKLVSGKNKKKKKIFDKVMFPRNSYKV